VTGYWTNTAQACVAVTLLCLGLSAAQAAPRASKAEEKGRVGNWYYISGQDGLFKVPRFVGAVHDKAARTSLVFTCQARPGVGSARRPRPLMELTLSEPIAEAGGSARLRMRLDNQVWFETKWTIGADGESTIEPSRRNDPLRLMQKMADKKHRVLYVETATQRLEFELDGADAVFARMMETCAKPPARLQKSVKRYRRRQPVMA